MATRTGWTINGHQPRQDGGAVMKYTCHGMKPIYTRSAVLLEPPELTFANRLARRLLGRRAVANSITAVLTSHDGRTTTYQVRLALPPRRAGDAAASLSRQITVTRDRH